MRKEYSDEKVIEGFYLLPKKTQQAIKDRARYILLPLLENTPTTQDIEKQIIAYFWEAGGNWDNII